MFANILLSMISLGDMRPVMLPAIIFLFMLWLMHRMEKRTAEDAVYRNFPFFKEAVNNYQQKLDFLHLRVDTLEERIIRLETSRPKGAAQEKSETTTPAPSKPLI